LRSRPSPRLDSYGGRVVHSADYRNPRPFEGEDVLGTGNAADIGVQLSQPGAAKSLARRADAAAPLTPLDVRHTRSELLRQMRKGLIEPVAAVELFTPTQVLLADGGPVEPDTVIAAALELVDGIVIDTRNRFC
jgi:hypothetical protein